jgi:hypothetical protein
MHTGIVTAYMGMRRDYSQPLQSQTLCSATLCPVMLTCIIGLHGCFNALALIPLFRVYRILAQYSTTWVYHLWGKDRRPLCNLQVFLPLRSDPSCSIHSKATLCILLPLVINALHVHTDAHHLHTRFETWHPELSMFAMRIWRCLDCLHVLPELRR